MNSKELWQLIDAIETDAEALKRLSEKLQALIEPDTLPDDSNAP